MEHVSDIDLIELIAGRLAPERRDAAEAHLAACAACRERRDAAARTWQVLGEWEVRADGRGLAAAVVAAARAEATLSPWRRQARAALRVAAALAIGAGIGHGAARLAPRGASEGVVAATDEDAVAQALGVAVLEGGAPAGLAEAVLGVEPPSEQEGSL
jgi:anti-sigma factor RsiW